MLLANILSSVLDSFHLILKSKIFRSGKVVANRSQQRAYPVKPIQPGDTEVIINSRMFKD